MHCVVTLTEHMFASLDNHDCYCSKLHLAEYTGKMKLRLMCKPNIMMNFLGITPVYTGPYYPTADGSFMKTVN